MKPAPAAVIAALAGFAEMSLELAAVRIFAPFFGDSAPVWTNVIGVMLAAMAVGAWIGGKLADPQRGAVRLALLLGVGGAFAVVAPFLSVWVGGFLVPADLPLDRAFAALVRGSLFATLLLFAPPVLLAGATTPLLVTSLTAGGLRVGRASALVATWVILGGLIGTFATTHLLVPGVGSRATVWIAAAALLICAAIAGMGRSGRSVAAAVGGAGIALSAAFVLHGSPGRAADTLPGQRVLAEVESRYQYLQVVDVDEPDGRRLRALKINEGLDSFHSVWLADEAFTGGRYYDWHVVTPWLAGDGRRPESLRVLSLGSAAGTFERLFRAVHPGCVVDSVEIDPAVVDLGRAWFDTYDGGAGRVFAGVDARSFVDLAEETWHVILVDAYERQIYVPAHLASVEFYRAVSDRLEDGGVVSVNVGGLSSDDPVVRTIGATMAAVFGEARALAVPSSRNFVLVARKRVSLDPGVLRAVPASPGSELSRILELSAREDAWQSVGERAEVLTDDRPFLDSLHEEFYAGSSGSPRAWSIGGPIGSQEVEVEAAELATAGDWDGAVAAIRNAAAATPYLRLLLGDARWRRGDFEGAREEYRAALTLDGGGAQRAVLEGRLVEVESSILPLERARSAGARNGWLAALGVLWVSAVAIGVLRLGRRAGTPG